MMPDIESLLEKLHKDASPSKAFEQRLLSQLQRRHVMMQSKEVIPEKSFSFGFREHFFGMMGKKGLSVFVTTLFVASTGGVSTYAYTSDSVTRDSFLYPVKRVIESVEKSFVSTPEETVQFHLKMMERRLAEVRHISQVRGVADEATLKDFSTEFDQGVTLAAAIPQPARREVFFRKFENIINTQEAILTRPLTVSAPIENTLSAPVPVTPVVSIPTPTPLALPLPIPPFVRSTDITESSPERVQPELPLAIIQEQLQRARQQIAEERAQSDNIDPPRVEETAPTREENREQRDVIQDVRRERRQNEERRDLEVDTPAIEIPLVETPPVIIPPLPLDPIIDPIQESLDGPRLEISETPSNTENGPRLEIPEVSSEVSRARRIIHSPEEKASSPAETPALDNKNEQDARVRIDSTEDEQQDMGSRLFIQDPVQR